LSKRPIIKIHSKKRDTFVIEKLEKTLFFLKKISYFYVAEKVFGLSTFFAVDVWVLSFLTFSMIGYVASFIITATSLQVLCVVLAAIRIFEVLIYLIITMLFARRWLILLVSNYLEIILWFGMFYSILFTAGSLKIHSEHYAIAILRENLAFMVANSTGTLGEFSKLSLLTVTIQNFVGLFLTLVVATRVISLLPRLKSSDTSES
jgi:hypothetical protein